MREFIWFMSVSLLAWMVFVGICLLGINYIEAYSCGKYSEATGRDTKWVFMDDCYIQAGGEWLQKDEYRAVVVARDGLRAIK